eukprot:TRINITY_DN1123_c2_g3_i1.p1 TRINITY_DN1123_c2_g3~~TRINITY_DN1123_c2_g3_i1.p1  ORF type:complete len:269 (-),score=39.10 TRINITY_DN1123_c2_g3_i1:357-1082(-)
MTRRLRLLLLLLLLLVVVVVVLLSQWTRVGAGPLSLTALFNGQSGGLHYQHWPLTNVSCYTFVTSQRHLIVTSGCEPVMVQSDSLYVMGTRIARVSEELCDRCYLYDYLQLLTFLFERVEDSFVPFVIMEDDVLFCPETLRLISWCIHETFNCKLGHGATLNLFTHHPRRPLLDHQRLASNSHIDWYLSDQGISIFQWSAYSVTHLGGKSVLGHSGEEIRACEVEERVRQPNSIDAALKLG